eukprot:GHVS01083591.1.p1 GENE.GHVS01083591.1~~GHVS01083591.1.p1  ORF type:complete len:120 (-),score=35.04 GHVS01083591.1:240-599(-)
MAAYFRRIARLSNNSGKRNGVNKDILPPPSSSLPPSSSRSIRIPSDAFLRPLASSSSSSSWDHSAEGFISSRANSVESGIATNTQQQPASAATTPICIFIVVPVCCCHRGRGYALTTPR